MGFILNKRIASQSFLWLAIFYNNRTIGYGDGTSAGQFGTVAPLLSVQLMRPLGAARTTGLTVTEVIM